MTCTLKRSPRLVRTRVRCRTGMILIVVLVVIAALSLAALTFSEWMFIERQAADVAGRQAQARALAASGIESVRLLLSSDPTTLADAGGWYDNPNRLGGVLVLDGDIARDRGRFSVVAPATEMGVAIGTRFGLEDETARLNLNTLVSASGDDEEKARERLMVLSGMTEDTADAILDWIDADEEPRAYGAEAEYYSTLDPPYAPKNGPLESVEELLLVRGVTPGLVFGVDANRNGYGDQNEPDPALIAEVDPTLPGADRGWASCLSLYSADANLGPDGLPKINVNQDDMETLFTELEEKLGTDWANFIVAYRQQEKAYSESSQKDDDGGSDGGQNSGGQNSGGQNSGGQNSGGQNGGGQNSGGQNSGGQNSGGQNSGGQNSGGQNSGGQNSGGQNSGGQNSGGQNSGGQNSGGQNSGGQNSGGQNSGGQNSGGQNSGGQNSGGQNSGGQNSGGQNSGGQNSDNEQPKTEETISGELDLTQAGKLKLKNVLDLVGQKVQVKYQGKEDAVVVDALFPDDPESMREYLPELLDALTIDDATSTPGRINVNLAPPSVLAAIPELPAEAVEEILSMRDEMPAAADSDRRYPTWLLTEGILTLDEMKAVMPYVTCAGGVYRAQIIGFFDGEGPSARIEAVFDATQVPARVVFWRDLSHLGRGYPLETLGAQSDE